MSKIGDETMNDMDDLATWLLEQIAEDERSLNPDWPNPGRLYCDDPAHWDDARVLAECDAKRRIVELHSVTDPCDAHGPDLRSIACETLQLLALPYADRPGYREEWRPAAE